MKRALRFGIFLSIILLTHQNIRVDSEQPKASSWLARTWTLDVHPVERSTEDYLSGCICRYLLDNCVVCYGGGRCKKFPKNLTLTEQVDELWVKTSAITEISREDVENFTGLSALVVDANHHLKSIAPETFQDLTDLKNLSISYNSDLTVLHPDVFKGLYNLETLRLVKNGFRKILDATEALQTEYLPKLSSLSLSENSFPEISTKSFYGLKNSKVTELELILCQIQTISPDAFNTFRRLEILRLGDNLISEDEIQLLLEYMLQEEIPIRLLNLYNSGFQKNAKLSEILVTVSQLNVSHLVLSRNRIENITPDLFPAMPSLKFLDIREVSAVNVEPGALTQQLFPNLQVILLGGNKLSGIIPGVLLPHISFLDISENTGGPQYSSYFDVSPTNLSEPLSLKSLDLSYNRISRISKNTFTNFDQLEVLGLKNATIFYISPGAFANLKNLHVLNLERNPFQPFNRFSTPIFDGLVNLKSLYLGNCKIAAFNNTAIFRNLVNLKYLDLRENELTQIDPKLIAPLVSLTGLDVTENIIQPWASRWFENNTQLKILIISTNRLSTVTRAMMEDLAYLERVDFTHNAYFCDCWAFNQTMIWLRERNMYANETSIQTSRPICSAPENWKGQEIATYLDSTFTCAQTAEKSNLTTPTYVFMAIVAIVSTLLGVFAYVYRWHIRYWIFLARMAFLRRHGWMLKKNKVHPGDYKYDVFVSYSNQDRNFIVRLVAMLENQHPFLRLCVYERDFEIGTVISDTVMEKVAMSRRTLLIVSNAFAKSQWCMWELQLAESHRLFFRNNPKEGFRDDPLVIIKLGPIAQCNMTPTLRFLLKSRIYLEWHHETKKQAQFWEKLRATLTPEHKKNLVANKLTLLHV